MDLGLLDTSKSSLLDPRCHLVGTLIDVERVPLSELPRVDVEAIKHNARPSADDVTVLLDGTRLDSPSKARAFILAFKAEMAARADAPHSPRDRRAATRRLGRSR